MPRRNLDKDALGLRVPSLAKICSERLIESSPNLLHSLDEHSKDLLLKQLLDERRKHVHESRELKILNKTLSYMPSADHTVYFGPRTRIVGRREVSDNVGDLEEMDVNKVNGYQMKDYFVTQWRYWDPNIDAEPDPHHQNEGWFSCGMQNLCWDTHIPELRLCKHWNYGHQIRRNAGFSSLIASDYCDPNEMIFLPGLISSPIMLYRLMAAFGVPVWDDRGWDGYKSLWAVRLQHETGSLMIYDYKGCVSAQFSGDLKACRSALRLLTWLVGDNVPHSYDGVLAGRAA